MKIIKRIPVHLAIIVFAVLLTVNFSCRQATINEQNQADTLAASAIDAETVINSIKEKAANASDGYFIQKSPTYVQGNYQFIVECFFDGVTKLPVLIYEDGKNGNYGSMKNHFLNQQNELYFVSKKVTENVGAKQQAKEYHCYYKDSKLKFAEMRSNDSVEDINKAKFKLIEEDVVQQEGLNLDVMIPYVNTLMSAAEMNNGFELFADRVSSLTDGNYFVAVTKSEEKNEAAFLLKDKSIETIAKNLCAKKQKVKIIYHYEGTQCVADKLEVL